MDNRFIHDDAPTNAPPRPTPEQLRQLLPRRRGRFIPYVVGGVIILGMIVACGFYLLQHKKSTLNDSATNTTPNTTATTPIFNALKPGTEVAAFKSADHNTTITYPKTWNASETDGTITISSPTVLLPGSGSEQRSGQVVLTLQPKQTTIPAFAGDGATAVRDSEKLTYTKPSGAQRAQTYLSFLHYASSASAMTMFDSLYVTGDFGYVSNQYIPESDITLANPIVSIKFLSCSDAVCSNPSPLAIPASAWDNTDFAGAIRPIITSLIIN